jgi:hypothetical protein
LRFGGNFHGRFFDHDRFFFNRFHRRHRFFFGFNPFFPGFYPGYDAYPAYYGDYSYPVDPSSYGAAYDSANAYNARNTELANAMVRLSDEVEHLREERELGQTLPPKSEPEKNSEPPESAVLVFRDKHVQEVKNYAIVGETFWILNEQQASIRWFPYRPPLKLAGLCQADHLSRNRRTCFGRPIAPGALHLKSICSVDFSIPSPLS